MAQQEQQVSKGSKSLRARLHILAYICAFIFLYIEGGKLSNMRIQGVGILFLVVAFLILIGQLRVVVLKRVAKFVDTFFIFPMYIVFIAIFIKGGLDLVNSTAQVELLWAIPVVILGIIVYDIVDIVKGARENARFIGKKATAIRWLKVLTFVLLVLVIFVRAFESPEIVKPLFWLIPAVISFMIVLILESNIKK